jgi:hypothetical protein
MRHFNGFELGLAVQLQILSAGVLSKLRRLSRLHGATPPAAAARPQQRSRLRDLGVP